MRTHGVTVERNEDGVLVIRQPVVDSPQVRYERRLKAQRIRDRRGRLLTELSGERWTVGTV